MKPRRRVALVTAAAVTAVAAATAGAMAATSTQSVTVAGCLAGGRITGVSVKTVPTCAASATPVQWAGQAASAVPVSDDGDPHAYGHHPNPNSHPDPDGHTHAHTDRHGDRGGVCDQRAERHLRPVRLSGHSHVQRL